MSRTAKLHIYIYINCLLPLFLYSLSLHLSPLFFSPTSFILYILGAVDPLTDCEQYKTSLLDMAEGRLPRLPIELIREICTLLPCSSAVAFSLVNRAIRRGCNHWTVWRKVALNNARCPVDLAMHCKEQRNTWQQYVVAGAFIGRRRNLGLGQGKTIATPQLSVFFDFGPGESSRISTVCTLYDITTNNLRLYGSEDAGETHAWLHAQATAFTLTIQYLSSLLGPSERSVDLDIPLVLPPIGATALESGGEFEGGRVAIARQAIGNRVVGLLYGKIVSTRAMAREQGDADMDLYSEPPMIRSIPFGRLMDLPLPFSEDSLRRFSTCHLGVMANPEFFVGQEWTGYCSLKGKANKKAYGVGGRHHDGHGRYEGDVFEDPYPCVYPYGRDFEERIRFRVVQDDGSRYFQVESNNFYSTVFLHHLLVRVDRKTGGCSVQHWTQLSTTTSIGVVTAFGLVTAMDKGPLWFWFWPRRWSMAE